MADLDTLAVEVFTEQTTLLSVSAPWVILPAQDGEIGVLHGHMPLITALTSGVLRCPSADSNGEERIAVHHGHAQVEGDRVTVLAQAAERAVEIDRERAQSAAQRAREALAELVRVAEVDVQRIAHLQAKLLRAETRLRALV